MERFGKPQVAVGVFARWLAIGKADQKIDVTAPNIEAAHHRRSEYIEPLHAILSAKLDQCGFLLFYERDHDWASLSAGHADCQCPWHAIARKAF
jgi:hypothetical protein